MMGLEKEKEHSMDEGEIRYRGVRAMPFIIGNEIFEKLGSIGTASNLLVYLSTVFNLKNVSAATLFNVFSGTANLAPLLGAFLSDTYLGRYKTLAFASISSFLGLVVIMLTAAISTLHPPKCTGDACPGPTAWQLAFLLSGLGLSIIGAGGIRPCNLAFGADQFNPSTESGRRGINSFFNWYYFTLAFAVIVSGTLIVYVQSNVNWAIGFAIPASLMLVSCAFFFLGSRIYVRVKPQGSPLTSVAQVLVASSRKRRLKPKPELTLFSYTPLVSINSKLPLTDQFRFLDKSAIITPEDQIKADGSAGNPWRLCSTQQAEELKLIVRVIPIWASAIIYYTAIVQQQTYAIFQALQSDRRLGTSGFQVPAASFLVFVMLSLTVWIPIYDRVIVPFIRRYTGREGGITVLQRMGTGIVLSVLTMVVSGVVEQKRREMALTWPTIGVSDKGGAVSSMSAFWLVPQLALAGLSEAFNSVGQSEFYYKQFPENMRSVAGAFSNCGMAGSSYLSGFLVTLVHQRTEWLPEDLNKGRLECFYYMIAALGVVNFGYFLVCANWYRYKSTAGDTTVEVGLDTNGNKVCDDV